MNLLIVNLIIFFNRSITGKNLPLIDMSIELMPPYQLTSPKFVIRIHGQIWTCYDVSNPTIKYLLSLVVKSKILDRTSKQSYITGYKSMLQYEMEEEEMQLKKFDQINVKLTYEKDRIFYFPIRVSR